MKRALFCCICMLVVFHLAIPSRAETGLLPTIDSVLQSGQSNAGKIEVSDNLDAYVSFGESFTNFDYDLKILFLQREAPQKEFTAKTVYPPFSDTDGFDENFSGVDIGNSRLWLRVDLMDQIPSYFCAGSLEEANYLIVAENFYEWDGTISVTDFADREEKDLPEFKDANEMMLYFIEHPRKVESITYYPKFGVYSLITMYETKTKKSLFWSHTYTSSMYFARNPAASLQWYNMTCIADLLDAVNEEFGVDAQYAKSLIESIDFVPQGKKDIWTSCIDAEEYSTAYHSITEYYWSMVLELKDLDPSQENKENYDLIIKDRNRTALSYFVNFCDYSGFDRSISSIEESKDYIATPDYSWMEEELKELVQTLQV